MRDVMKKALAGIRALLDRFRGTEADLRIRRFVGYLERATRTTAPIAHTSSSPSVDLVFADARSRHLNRTPCDGASSCPSGPRV